MTVSPIPPGLHNLTAQLNVEGAAKAIDFYKAAFGAEEVMRAPDPSGQRIWHAEVRIGATAFFVNDVFREMDPSAKPSHSAFWLYVPDVDAAYARAVAAGATSAMEPADMFWGDRLGSVLDPFGQRWTIATRVKNMTPDEIRIAEQEFVAKMSAPKH